MPNVLTIYRREMGSYFTSPIAYIFICVFLVVMGIYFFLLNGFFQQSNPDMRPYFMALPLAFVLLIPASLAVYVGCLIVTGTFGPEDITLMKQMLPARFRPKTPPAQSPP